MSKIEANENKLAELRIKNADKLEEINDAIANKRYAQTLVENKIKDAQARRDFKQAEQLQKQIEKLDVALEALDADRERYAKRALRDEQRLEAQISKQKTEYNKLGETLKSIRGKLNSALGAISVIGVGSMTLKFLNDVADRLDALGKRARDIGVTASQLQELDNQAKLVGLSSEQMDMSLRAFNRNISLATMGTGEARKALDSMGISLTKANGVTKTQAELLEETALYFARNAGEAENAGRAARIFGERGGELLRVFEQGEDAVKNIFDAEGIDEASEAAERYKDAMQNVSNVAFKLGSRVIQGFSQMIDDGAKLFGYDLDYERAEKKANEETKKRRALMLEAERKQREEEAKAQAEAIKLENEYNKILNDQKKILEKEQPLSIQLLNVRNQISILNEKDKRTEDLNEAIEYQKEISKLLSKELELKKQIESVEAKRKKEFADSQNKEKERLENIKSELESKINNQKESREEFELQTKIDILKAQGKTKEAESLEFARNRNKLMEQYGYSLDQANKIQKTLDNLKKGDGVQYSDDAKKKAEEILKRGKGGSIGDKTLAEAQAIVDGKEVEGGFSTSLFKKYETKGTKGIKDIKIDSKAMQKDLNDEGKNIEAENNKTLTSLDATMKALSNLISEIKNSVNMIATKKQTQGA